MIRKTLQLKKEISGVMMKSRIWNVRNCLCAANLLHLVVGVFLIAVAAYGRSYGEVSRLRIISVVMVVGVFLILISTLGIAGALRQNQIILFTYIAVMMLMCIFHFTTSCFCLALGRDKQERLLSSVWEMMNNETRRSVEQQLDCCGLINSTEKKHVFHTDVNLCIAVCKTAAWCFTCGDVMLQRATEVLRVLGGVGLFCSFSQLVTVWLAVRYRNQKNIEHISRSSS